MKQVPWRQLGLLLIVAFALRLAAGWAWQSRLAGRFGMGDSESYWKLASAIATGQPYQYGPEHARVFRTPGYPLLLAPIVCLAGDGRDAVLLARAEAALLGTLAVLGVWWLTRLLFDDRAALAGGRSGDVLSGRDRPECVGSQRGPVLPADAPATGAVDSRLEGAVGRRGGPPWALAPDWRPGRPR